MAFEASNGPTRSNEAVIDVLCEPVDATASRKADSETARRSSGPKTAVSTARADNTKSRTLISGRLRAASLNQPRCELNTELLEDSYRPVWDTHTSTYTTANTRRGVHMRTPGSSR